MSDFLKQIRPIMQRHGVTISAEAFHEAVNLAFHASESRVYDNVHQEMWQSLPAQFGLLSADILQATAVRPVSLLDIGCGTGLSTELFLNTELGRSVRKVDLLDTSPEMLEKATERSSHWKVEAHTHQGMVQDLAAAKYDVILTCSVLHHIPDLQDFLSSVRGRLNPGGVFLHLQDPNGDYGNDPEYLARCEELRRYEDSRKKSRGEQRLSRFHPKRLLKRLIEGPPVSYMAQANQRLLDEKVITSSLEDEEVWTITDLHDFTGEGISLRRLQEWMEPSTLLTVRCYGFFGKLEFNLPPELAQRERELTLSRCRGGHFLSAAWVTSPVQ